MTQEMTLYASAGEICDYRTDFTGGCIQCHLLTHKKTIGWCIFVPLPRSPITHAVIYLPWTDPPRLARVKGCLGKLSRGCPEGQGGILYGERTISVVAVCSLPHSREAPSSTASMPMDSRSRTSRGSNPTSRRIIVEISLLIHAASKDIPPDLGIEASRQGFHQELGRIPC